MLHIVLLFVLVQSLAYGAPNCKPPAGALTKIRAYLSYMSRTGRWSVGPKRFSFAEADGDALFLQHELPLYSDGAQRYVYAFRDGKRLLVAGCAANPQWTTCTESKFREFIQEPAGNAVPSIGPVCDLSIIIPAWRPSPDSPSKRRLAAEVLEELHEYGYENPKEVYVRDFNLADPDLEFYIVDRTDKGNLQGCDFDAEVHPHCRWHLFGQASVDKLKREIMAQPYRVFPPATPVADR